jgi:hypothetical protein
VPASLHAGRPSNPNERGEARDVSRDIQVASAPRSWVEAVYPSLTYFNEVDRGGHFAAWEGPQLFSEEVRAAFASLR